MDRELLDSLEKSVAAAKKMYWSLRAKSSKRETPHCKRGQSPQISYSYLQQIQKGVLR